MIVLQAFINIACARVDADEGIPLPFVSYGIHPCL